MNIAGKHFKASLFSGESNFRKKGVHQTVKILSLRSCLDRCLRNFYSHPAIYPTELHGIPERLHCRIVISIILLNNPN